MSVIPAIIGAGASLLGGFINNQYAQMRSDQQWDRMNYMQDKMNAYNAPVAQMARLREAGLNPNLVYAHGGAVMESAVGNAPQPPNTAPIDTQGVLQMVQTIVGAMLEKDKIQAQKDMQSEQIQSNKEISEAKNTTTKEVTQMQNKSSERNVDVQTQSNENIATERNKTEKEMNTARIQSNEQIEFAKLSESARQADMRNAIDRAHVVIDQFLAQIAKYRADTEAMESYSRKALNEQQYRLHESLDDLTLSLERGKIREQQIRNGITEIQDFLSRPGYIDKRELASLYDKYDISYTQSQLDSIKLVFDNMHERLGSYSVYKNNPVGTWIEAFWDSMFKPVVSVGSIIAK